MERGIQPKRAMLTEFVDGILSFMREQVVRIVLYGSVARGTDEPGSDVDIALILRGKMSAETEAKLTDLSADLDLKYDVVLSVVDVDEEFFLKWKKAIPFYTNVEKEGIVLWRAA